MGVLHLYNNSQCQFFLWVETMSRSILKPTSFVPNLWIRMEPSPQQFTLQNCHLCNTPHCFTHRFVYNSSICWNERHTIIPNSHRWATLPHGRDSNDTLDALARLLGNNILAKRDAFLNESPLGSYFDKLLHMSYFCSETVWRLYTDRSLRGTLDRPVCLPKTFTTFFTVNQTTVGQPK